MIRYSHEKNNDNFRRSEAEAFNDAIQDLCLIELPLIDRQYTWSNHRSTPTLERLDRAFINLDWDATRPNSTLSSLTRTTSDHVPLKVQISTSIPKSPLFCFENAWTLLPSFQDAINTAWNLWHTPPNAAFSLLIKLKRTRAASKQWRKHHSSVSQWETDCKIVISLLDSTEEQRPLNPMESNLRFIVVSVVSRTVKEKFLHWKQRSKVRVAIEGDENTRYFHACASQRLRSNKIQVLEHDGIEVTAHDPKARLLYELYNSLLGSPRQTTWAFDLSALYPEPAPDLSFLDRPFSGDEIKGAFDKMRAFSSPGPDGFESPFYKSTWPITAPTVTTLFESFHQRNVELDRINRSYIVLLPKKDQSRSPVDF